MTSCFERVLIGIGCLLLAASLLFWLVVLSGPFIVVYLYLLLPRLADWTAMDTFGALIALGFVSLVYLVVTWGKDA